MNYILLARGGSLETARVLVVSADQSLINKFVADLTEEADHQAEKFEERSEPENADKPEEQHDSPSKPFEVVKGGQD
jgi:hypothetical protein